MPDEHMKYLVWIWKNLNNKRNDFEKNNNNKTIYPNWEIKDTGRSIFYDFFLKHYDPSKYKDLYIYYGKGNYILGGKWVKKLIFSSMRNTSNGYKQERNLELYYRAREAWYNPDDVKIDEWVLKITWKTKDDIGDLFDLSNTRLGWPYSIGEISEILKEELEKKMKKKWKKKKYKDPDQTELFSEETQKDTINNKEEKDQKPDYGNQWVSVDGHLWFRRKKKKPDDPNIVYESRHLE